MSDLKKGQKVKYFPIRNRSEWRLETVASEPFEMCGSTMVKLEGKSGCFCVDNIELIDDE